MKRENIEKMNRAIGVLEGVSYSLKALVGDAIDRVIALIEEIMEDEEENDETQSG